MDERESGGHIELAEMALDRRDRWEKGRDPKQVWDAEQRPRGGSCRAWRGNKADSMTRRPGSSREVEVAELNLY